MDGGRVGRIVGGAVLAVVGVPLLLAALVLGWLHAVERDDDGWLRAGTERLTTPTRAITSEEVDLGLSPTEDDWVPFDGDLARVRLGVDGQVPLFVGIGPAAAVERYLDGVAHDVVHDGAFVPGHVEHEAVGGHHAPAPPSAQRFWIASGTDGLEWDVEPGRWRVVVMRADAGAGVDVDLTAAVRVGWLGPVALALGGLAVALLSAAAWLLVSGARGGRAVPAGATALPGSYPVRVDARLDEPLSRGLWLVKWLLAIPHVVVLAFLWLALGVTTVVAFFAILVTARYPRALFDFAVGVLRWTWRVAYYAFSGIGTDRYPPFSLDPDPAYPADLAVEHPERLSRGLALVKWWLLAIPHYLVVAVLTGGFGIHAGVVTALVLVAGVVLLATGSYPRPVFDVVVGCNRWAYRVSAYALLLTDAYPPFRFDAGGRDPGTPAEPGPVSPQGPPPAPDAGERLLVDAGGPRA